jgi:phenylacetate-coenzyme A ligase PaaK-like adenylate-forming protein
MRSDLSERIFSSDSGRSFSNTALEIFRFQSENNPVYRNFLDSLGKRHKEVHTLEEIPYLPVEFFRTQKVVTAKMSSAIVFESSGTTTSEPGRHYVVSPELYETSFLRTFRMFYGEPSDYLIAGLLPSYIERSNSSLVYMVNTLIKYSLNPLSGFYMSKTGDLIKSIRGAISEGRKVLLLGVSFALLDLAEKHSPDLHGAIVMETGGMKGRRVEITRTELHEILKEHFNVHSIHSEYGMTELLSQAYSSGEGIFYTPPWMKVLIRDPQDPLSIIGKTGVTGGINIIDLANLYSCSFIATGDLGSLRDDGGFEVIGRFDNSEIRGCNLLAG